MEKVNIGSNRFTRVQVADEAGAGNAHHEYYISREPQTSDEEKQPAGEFGFVRFQNGPIGENGINGCHQEDLLAIVLHRLQSFQSGEFACRENALAITKIEEAMHWLNARTADRQKRGVEGTSSQ